MLLAYTIWDTGVFFTGKGMNRLNMVVLSAKQISKYSNNGQEDKAWYQNNGIYEQTHYVIQVRVIFILCFILQ